VVDDASPDGTGALADALAAADERVHVLHRTAKAGLGPAYVAGFAWALEHGYDVVVEMDADGSHPPEQLPDLLAALEGTRGDGADLVLGSRYVRGGRVQDWPLHRQLLSRLGNAYTRWALRLPLTDATGGYRAVRAELLDRLHFGDVASQGYCFQVDWAWRAWRAGARVVEVPITFTERARGRSKMSRSIVQEALVRVTVWGLQDRLADRLPGRVRRPVPGRARDDGRSTAAR
jgi:glycosyltransferase involved in cell wall biosynthesis